MKKTIQLFTLLLILSSCSTLKLNKVSMREYFSHIHKSGKYEVKEIIGKRAVLKHYKDTIDIPEGNVKEGDFVYVTVVK